MGRVESDGVYSDKLKRMREMLKTDPTTDDVVEELGKSVEFETCDSFFKEFVLRTVNVKILAQ